jgi:hypothetical protein
VFKPSFVRFPQVLPWHDEVTRFIDQISSCLLVATTQLLEVVEESPVIDSWLPL